MEAEELEHLEELGKKQLELFDEIRTESERACVIVGAANIDALITKALLPVKEKNGCFLKKQCIYDVFS